VAEGQGSVVAGVLVSRRTLPPDEGLNLDVLASPQEGSGPRRTSSTPAGVALFRLSQKPDLRRQFYAAFASLSGGLEIGSGAGRATSWGGCGFVGDRLVPRSDFASLVAGGHRFACRGGTSLRLSLRHRFACLKIRFLLKGFRHVLKVVLHLAKKNLHLLKAVLHQLNSILHLLIGFRQMEN